MLVIQMNNLTLSEKAKLVQTKPTSAYVKSNKKKGRKSNKTKVAETNTKLDQFYSVSVSNGNVIMNEDNGDMSVDNANVTMNINSVSMSIENVNISAEGSQ
jgi:hypothetical protein